MKATIRFNPCAGYSNQYYTPVLNPKTNPLVRDVQAGWLNVLRGGVFDTQGLRKAEIEGGWDAKRFSFVLETGFENVNMERKVFLYGYTDPCEVITDQTKLYFTRLIEIQVAKMVKKDGSIVRSSRNIRDLLIFPKVERGTPDTMYNAKVRSVFQRIGTNMMFGQHAAHGCQLVNMTGSLRTYNSQCAPTSDISAESWTAAAVVALMKSGSHHMSDFYSQGDEEVFQLAADMTEESTLAHVDVWDEMTSQSRLGFDGYLELHELKAIMETRDAVIVNSRIPGDFPMGSHSVESKVLFDFFVKQAVAEAKYNGLAVYQKAWERRGGEVVETVHTKHPLAFGTDWDNLEPYEQLAEAGAGTSPLQITMPAASIPSLLQGDVWKVNIRIDLAGDIVGVVSHGVDEDTSVFVRPAWAVAMTSGLLVSEQEMDNITRIVHMLHKEYDRIQLLGPQE